MKNTHTLRFNVNRFKLTTKKRIIYIIIRFFAHHINAALLHIIKVKFFQTLVNECGFTHYQLKIPSHACTVFRNNTNITIAQAHCWMLSVDVSAGTRHVRKHYINSAERPMRCTDRDLRLSPPVAPPLPAAYRDLFDLVLTFGRTWLMKC